MSISKIMKKVAEKKLGEIGFERVETKSTHIWLYKRQYENQMQEVQFQKSQLCQGIELRIDLMENILKIVDVAKTFSPELVDIIQRSPYVFIEYNNEKELELIISEFTDVVIKKILPIYKGITRPRKYAAPEQGNELYEHVSFYAEQFMQKYQMDYETEVSKIKKCIIKIEGLIDENRHLKENEANEFLLCIAAYFGEMIRKAHNGKWKRIELGFLIVFKTNEDSYSDLEDVLIPPLDAIYSYWDKPEIYFNSVMACYKRLLGWLYIEKEYELD